MLRYWDVLFQEGTLKPSRGTMKRLLTQTYYCDERMMTDRYC